MGNISLKRLVQLYAFLCAHIGTAFDLPTTVFPGGMDLLADNSSRGLDADAMSSLNNSAVVATECGVREAVESSLLMVVRCLPRRRCCIHIS